MFKKLRKIKRFKKSSQQWLSRQLNDPFIERAKAEGFRSRASFKILEINKKFKIFNPGKIIVDLGASPGGWSQIAVKDVGDGNVIAIDLLEMNSIPGVEFLRGDFLSHETHKEILFLLKKIPGNDFGRCDVVMSDMAANTTGDKGTDHLRIILLLEEALDFARKILIEGGCFVGKIFQGGSSDEIVQKLRQSFSVVKYFKPESSRKDSSECYLIALNFRNT